MDLVSHVLIGRALGTPPKNSKKDVFWITFFSFLPDLPQIIIYIYLGFINSRAFFIPFNTDWDGFRDFNPVWSALWEIPHSVFFVLLVIFPIVLFFKLPKMALFVYALHIIIDLFTHSGEWGVKLFYPFSYQIKGFTNAWSWSFADILLSWSILVIVIIIFHLSFRRKNK